MDAGMDPGIFCRELLGEMLIESYIPTTSGRLPSDFLPVTQEKRLTFDIKEAAMEFDPEGKKLKEVFRWVATESQVADHLTKVKPAHLLRDLLDRG